MTLRISRIGRLMTGAAALAALIPAAHAQQGTPTPTPRATPPIITLPGANGYSLPASGAQPTTRPVVQPTPTPTPVAVRPTPTPRAATVVRATPTPRPAATAASRPALQVEATPTPAATPTAQATPLAQPIASPTPEAQLTATPTPVPIAAPSQGTPWLWILVGAGMAIVLVALGWLLGRRRKVEPIEEVVAPPRPVAAPKPAPKPAPVAPPQPLAPRPAAPVEPIVIELRPIAIELSPQGAVLDFELMIANASPAPVEGLRVAFGLMSASASQDDLIASFHQSQLPSVIDAFDLAPGAAGRLPGKLGIAADKINVVEVGGRPMFVPILLIDLRWRSGLSIKRQAVDFMVGVGGQGDKIGPIWLDRGAQRHERLNANRYFPKALSAAAE